MTRCRRKHLHRTNEVERGNAVIGEEQDRPAHLAESDASLSDCQAAFPVTQPRVARRVRMERREMLQMLVLAALGGVIARGSEVSAHNQFDPRAPRPKFVMLVHPGMVLPEIVPALTVFELTLGDVQLVWTARTPVTTDVDIGRAHV